MLVAELQHRTRNLLTVVQSIALQTMEATATRDEFEDGFLGRLRSLSRVQGLLSNEGYAPITVADLLNMEFEAFCSEADFLKIELSGPDITLKGDVAQALALGIHELATNALKHGALAGACEHGRLAVSWRVEGVGSGRNLVLEWREDGLSLQLHGVPRKARGYGRMLIEEDLPYSLSAKTAFELKGDALRCRIGIPFGYAASDAASS